MPRAQDPAVRENLLVTAAEILATEGATALTSRRLAAAAGTSTMALYTYFGSMDQLRRDLRRDGFTHLCHAIDKVPTTDDAVTDLAAAAATYVRLGSDNPAWYRALFADLPPESDAGSGVGVHERLGALVERCVVAGRFPRPDETTTTMWAAEIWLVAHGVVNLSQSQLLPAEPTRFLLGDMLFRLVVGFGDRPDLAKVSIDRALE